MPPKAPGSSLARPSKFSLLRTFTGGTLIALALATAPAFAETADTTPAQSAVTVANRLTSPIIDGSRVTLKSTVHPLANKANDRGLVSDSVKLERLQVLLKRSDAQEAGLKRLVNDLHSPGSASYHKWLTPDQFGKQFGPSDADLATIEAWLQAQGFTVTKLQPGRQVLEISGTAGQLRNAFHTQMHQYAAQGGTHFANANAPDVPAALAPVFGGFVSLNNFHLKNYAKLLGKAQVNPITHESKAAWTKGSSNPPDLILAPGDFAVQYDLNPLYTAGTKGDGQTIAIANDSNINVALVNDYRTLFGLPANPPQVIIDGNDPGVDGINSPYGPNGDSVEAYLDVEVAGAVAPNAQIDLVIANDTAVTDGLTLAMEHAVYSNIAPIVSVSFGECEAAEGSKNSFVSSLWEQAAAQGQTVLISTGDSGSAGCDSGTEFAVYGAAVNGLASTPYNVAVGGTDFYYSGGTSTLSNYWNLTPTDNTPTVSLKTPAPEQPWNNSQYGQDLFSYYDTNNATTIGAGSGGPSTVGLTDGSGSSSPYPKPSWQTGTGVPADGARDLPDLSLFASNGANDSYYPICAGDGDCQPVAAGQTVQVFGVGGTSASTPAFAGMMALVNQKYGRQGQANYTLYPLAAQFPNTFHDVTVGTITVPCATTGSYAGNDCKTVSNPITVTDDTYGTTVEGEISVDGTNAAYNATTGYDLATGLGTVDANNLVTNWGSIALASTVTTLTPSVTNITHGTAVTISGTVTGPGTPTGDVSLVTTSAEPLSQANQNGVFFTLANGTYSDSVNFLPGGSYTISGYYPGDSVNGPSSSSPVAITVTPESSTTVLNVESNLSKTPTLISGTVQYGALAILDAIPSGASPTTTVPTGSVNFLDGSTAITTVPLDSAGHARYNGALAVGSHSITAKYSGDVSYGASTSSANSFTVTKNTPLISFSYTNSNSDNSALVNGQVTYLTVQVENSAGVNGLAQAPTGTVSVTGAPSGTNTTATLASGVDPSSLEPEGTAIFAVPSNASGNYTLTFNYAGDTNYDVASTGAQPIPFANGTGTATTIAATASATSASPTSQVTVAVTVTSSGSTAPTGTVYLVASGYILAKGDLPTSSGKSAAYTFIFDSSSLFQGNNLITVQYIPATAVFGASATTVTINNPLSDFAMVPISTILNVPGTGSTAGTQTDAINLSSTNGFAGAVSLSCTGAGGVTCSVNPTAATLISGGVSAATVTVNTTAVSAAGSYNVVVTGANAAGTVIHTLGLTVVTPKITAVPSFSLTGTAIAIAVPGDSETSTITVTPANSFTGNVDLTCAVTSGPTGATGTPTCSLSPVTASISGTAAATSTLTVNTGSTTTAGAYTVTVTGASGSLTASTPVAVTVTPVAAPSFSLTGTAVTIASQGATGTSTITVTPASGFTGTVALTCAVTSSPSGAIDSPTCSAASASVTGTSAATATLTINTTPETAKLDFPSRGIYLAGGGVTLGALFLFATPFGKRRKLQLKSLRMIRLLSVAAFFALLAGAVIGCGGGSSSGGTGGGGSTGGTTAGAYTLTITGTGGSTTATTTIAVTVN